jgi:hypothetical protein
MFVMLLIFTVIGEKSHLKMILTHTNDSIRGGGGVQKDRKLPPGSLRLISDFDKF